MRTPELVEASRCRGRTVSLLAACLLAAAVAAATTEYTAVTTTDPAVPLDELGLLLMPLDRAELEVEAVAWMALVKTKVHELADAEIAAKYKRIEIARAAEAAAAATKAKEAAEAAEELLADRAAGEEVQRGELVAAEQNAEQKAGEAQEAIEAAAEVEEKAGEHQGAREVTESAQEAAEEEGTAVEDAQISASDIRKAGEADAEKLEEVAASVADAVDAKSKVREAIFDRVAELRNQRVDLLTRARLVLDQLEKKAGEVEEQRKYLDAVSGVQVDVTDTRATWATLTGWLEAPQGGIRWLKNLGRFVAVLLGSWVLAWLLGRLVERAMRLSDKISKLSRVFVKKSLRRMIIFLGVIAALATLEINVGPVLAVVGAAGFVLAFALQDSLGNLASGLMIMIFRPFDMGDVVLVAGARGRVHAMNIVSTTIKTPDNQTVIVPNRKIWGDVITNITGSERRRVDLTFKVGVDADLDRVQEVLERIVADNPHVLSEPGPVIRVAELEATAVSVICRPWVETSHYGVVRSEITRAVRDGFARAGIPMPVPVQIQRLEPQPGLR